MTVSYRKQVGVFYAEGPPVPIPNTEVKPVSYTHLDNQKYQSDSIRKGMMKFDERIAEDLEEFLEKSRKRY